MLDVPSPRTVDPVVLDQFREIEPTAEMFYLGESEWAFGLIKLPLSPGRWQAAMTILAQEAGRSRGARGGARYKVGLAALQGFKLICKFTDGEINSGLALKEYRYGNFVYRQDREKAFEEAYWHAAGGPSAADREDELRTEAVYRAKDAFRHVFKTPLFSYSK